MTSRMSIGRNPLFSGCFVCRACPLACFRRNNCSMACVMSSDIRPAMLCCSRTRYARIGFCIARVRLPADAIGRWTPVAAGAQQAALHLRRRMIPHDVSIRLHALGRAAEGVASYIHRHAHVHDMAWHGMAWRWHGLGISTATCSLLWTRYASSS